MVLEGSEELLIADHSGLVHSIVKRFTAIGASVGLDEDDLMSVGNIGLLLAIRRFEDRGCAFMTYAYPYVKGYVLTEINRVRWGAHDDYSMSGPVMHQFNGEREPIEDRLSPLDVLIQAEDIARVRDAMDKADGGELVRLRYIEDVKPIDIQKQFDRCPFWVTKKIRRGISKMKEILDPGADEHGHVCLSGLYSRVR